MIDDKFVRERITALRMSKGVSEVELSLAVGMSKNYINNLVNHEGYPSLQTLLDICDYFGITPIEFFDEALEDAYSAKQVYGELSKLCKGDTARI